MPIYHKYVSIRLKIKFLIDYSVFFGGFLAVAILFCKSRGDFIVYLTVNWIIVSKMKIMLC